MEKSPTSVLMRSRILLYLLCMLPLLFTRVRSVRYTLILVWFLSFCSSSVLAAETNLDHASGLFPSSTSVVSTPVITVRFANPDYNCETSEYCLDVEFKSDIPGEELFGMNVRFFYDDAYMEIISMSDFQGGYGPLGPNPGFVGSSLPGFGTDYFGYPAPGVVDFVNTAVQLVDMNAPALLLDDVVWTKLFQICFSIDGTIDDSTNFCPPIVWDLEVDPANGGYLSGDNGVVMTVVDDQSSLPATENVVQFNWQYTGDGSMPPYGEPAPTDCIDISCGVTIVCPADVSIHCEDSTLPDSTGIATAESFCSGEIVISYTDSLAGDSCTDDSYIYRTWTAVDTCGNEDNCLQLITIDNRGSICGTVFNDLGQPMPGVTLILMADLNMNEIVDGGDTIYATLMTDALTGKYCFTQVTPCSYIIQEQQPINHGSLEDFDTSPDPDGDDSVDGPDNEIPVQLTACEIDSNNNFINIVCPDSIPGLLPDTICEGDFVEIIYEDLDIGLLTYTWDFGSGSTPSLGSGLGPHNIYYEETIENQADGVLVDLTISKDGCPDTTVTIKNIEINTFPNTAISGNLATGCYYTDRVLQPVAPEIPGAIYHWNFGSGAVPTMAYGYGPHTIYYTSPGMKTVSLSIAPNEPGAHCPDSTDVQYQILSCPANIVGNVKSTDDVPIPDVNIKLFKDQNTDGIADDGVAVRSVFTTGDGNYSMASLTPGNYVLIQTQPIGWISFDDGDPTPDNDIVDNIDSLDNLIPVTLVPLEVDQVNKFVEYATPGTISGSVFVDLNENEFPDEEEGLSNIVISLFHDANADGIADDNIPIESQETLVDGSFSFTNVLVGNYVIAESQPGGYVSVIDKDMSNDGDVVMNLDIYNDTIPVTVTNGELDKDNYFIDVDSCGLFVTNINDDGSGSLRQAINCAQSGDTILFHAALAGETIIINSARILFDKDLVLYSSISPTIKLMSQIPGFFEIGASYTVEFSSLDITSGLSGFNGAAFRNDGTLKLNNVKVYRNPSLPPNEYLIFNATSSELILGGSCLLDND